MTTPLDLHDQIELAERRVRLEKAQLMAAAQGLRVDGRCILSGGVGIAAIFLAAAVVASLLARRS